MPASAAPPGPAPGLMIAAPRSGSGKTTLTLGLLRALARQGRIVQPMKCGPDYIDPVFHARAGGRTGRNLDGWAMPPGLLDALIEQAGEQADLVICEALMGLFDGVGAPGATDDGASANIAARAGWPVVLVLDVAGQSQSAGAVAAGFSRFRADVEVAGVVLNRVASERHRRLVERGMKAAGLPVFGALPRQTGLELPERHLGLVQAGELSDLERRLDRLADVVERHVDVPALTATARRDHRPAFPIRTALPPPGQRIALAQDAAFSFVYPHLIDGWRRMGAEILPFSPLADEPPPPADVAWLPGGYPELHAGRLAGNDHFLSGLRAFAARGPVHGECGGAMVLGRGLVDQDGARHGMAGLLDVETSFAARKLHLGYRRARLLADTVLGRAGTVLRGHEFHYSSTIAQGGEPLFHAHDAEGRDLGPMGNRSGQVTGSFFHVVAADPSVT